MELAFGKKRFVRKKSENRYIGFSLGHRQRTQRLPTIMPDNSRPIREQTALYPLARRFSPRRKTIWFNKSTRYLVRVMSGRPTTIHGRQIISYVSTRKFARTRTTRTLSLRADDVRILYTTQTVFSHHILPSELSIKLSTKTAHRDYYSMYIDTSTRRANAILHCM